MNVRRGVPGNPATQTLDRLVFAFLRDRLNMNPFQMFLDVL